MLSVVLSFVALSVASAAETSGKVFVLKHPDKSKPAVFVQVEDEARLRQLVESDGYELVVRETPQGPVAITGDIIPDELARAENAAAAQRAGELSTSLDVYVPDQRPVYERDPLDFGIGLNLGITAGLKARIVGTLRPGVVVGVDLDIGTIIFLSEATASAIVGYSFEPGSHVIRPYVTIGGGNGVAFAIFAAENTKLAKAGVGVEWKPARWFGLGLEGGITAWFHDQGDKKGELLGMFPFARLNIMFYFL